MGPRQRSLSEVLQERTGGRQGKWVKKISLRSTSGALSAARIAL